MKRERKNLYTWGNGLISWTEGKSAFLSVTFSWNLPAAFQQAVFYKSQGFSVFAGGPAVQFNRDYLADVTVYKDNSPDAVAKHNPNATFTSRGCVRKCKFCLVPKIEGSLKELTDWPLRPTVCDNNFLACSISHFDRVIDKLKPLEEIDFNQGLDARFLTSYHAERLAELDISYLRLAWDSVKYEKHFRQAFEILLKAGFPLEVIRIYVLVGFRDTPEDALYRLQTIADLGIRPTVMRFQPLGILQRNQYLSDSWTEYDMWRIKKYFGNLSIYGHIPFQDFRGTKRERVPKEQMSFNLEACAILESH